MRNFIGIVCLILFLSSCYYDNLGELHPEAGLTEDCDSTNVTFTKDIKPILDQYCGAGNGNCHSSSNTGANPALDTYSNVSDLVNLDQGVQLLSSITHDDPANVSPMPKDGGKLSECKINKFRAWINNNLPQ